MQLFLVSLRRSYTKIFVKGTGKIAYRALADKINRYFYYSLVNKYEGGCNDIL